MMPVNSARPSPNICWRTLECTPSAPIKTSPVAVSPFARRIVARPASCSKPTQALPGWIASGSALRTASSKTAWKSPRCTIQYGAPKRCTAVSPRSNDRQRWPVLQSRNSRPSGTQTTRSIASRRPSEISNREPLEPICTPAPTSFSSEACSYRRTRWPRWIKASAVVRPPRPAPAMRTSGMEAFFPPQAEDVLHRPIGKAEQDGFRRRAMVMRVPAWNNENVARLPTEHGIADDRLTGAFDDGINRAIGGPIRCGFEPSRQQRHERADRWHWGTTRCRIDVAEFVAVVRIRIAITRQRYQCVARPNIRIAENRGRLRLGFPVDRNHVGPVASRTVPHRPRDRLAVGIRRLGEADVEHLDHRHVQSIEPNHRLIRFIAVIMPRPWRGNHEVARLHDRALALNRGVSAMAFDDEAQRRRGVTVCRRDLSGQDHLQAGEQRVRDAGLPCEARVLPNQDAPLGFLG